ncbi:hypothetical protein AA0112_g1738 [Alternaria arborescens]|nr:hypothetical protein AA0112_g1738 [Alternaria arborescens]
MPSDNDNVEEQPSQLSFSVAIILYTGPPASPFTSWTLIRHVENQPDMITGANRLLADLRRGMGGVVGVCMQTGNWTTIHGRIPNIVPGVGEVKLKKCENEEEYEEDQDSIEQDNEDGKRDDESDELEDTGKGGWSPRLESITEEI